MPEIPKEVLDQIVADGPMTAQQLNAAMMALRKAIVERALGGCHASAYIGQARVGVIRPVEAVGGGGRSRHIPASAQSA